MPENQEKQSVSERTKELTAKLEAGLKELVQSDKYRDYLTAMSRLNNYSSRNIMLIHQQLPHATRVASFKTWEEEFNRHVKKGERALWIWAPIGEKQPETKLMEKLDPETGAPLLDEDGKPVMEEMTALVSRPRFKEVPVFDVSQTEGEPLPEIVEPLTGGVAHYEAFLDALRAVSPLPIVFEPMREEQDGYCRYGEQIGIREGMSETQTVSAVVHELAHARLHDKNLAPDASGKSKNIKETEAESLAFVVNSHFGIDTSANSFGYLAEYGSRDMKELKASLDTIRREANTLINAIDGKFREICAERGIDLAAEAPAQAEQPVSVQPEQETAAKQAPGLEPGEVMPDPAIGLSEMNLYGYSQEGMLPVLQARALKLYDSGLDVYMLNPDNTESMAFTRAEIEAFDGIFGVDASDWQKTPEYFFQIDHYEIYQIPDGDDLRDVRFAPIAYLEAHNLSVDPANYDLVYTAPLVPTDTLEGIFDRFNQDVRPDDFSGRSMSVSDVVVLQRDGVRTAHFADFIGFTEVPGFLGEKQPEIAAPVTEQAEPLTGNGSPVSPLQVYIENVGDEMLGGVTIPLPTTPEALQPFLDKLNIHRPWDLKIVDLSSNIEGFCAVLTEAVQKSQSPDTLNELNYLAARLGDLDADDLETVSAALEAGRHCDSVMEIVSLTFPENLENMSLQPAYNVKQYGEHLIDAAKDDTMAVFTRLEESTDLDEYAFAQYVLRLEASVDFNIYGRNAVEAENGAFTKFGYLTEIGEFQEIYNIPSEYRVFTPDEPFIRQTAPETDQPVSADVPVLPRMPPTPESQRFGENVAAVEAQVKAGESIKLSDLMVAIRADQQQPGSEPSPPTPPPNPEKPAPAVTPPEPVVPTDVPVYRQSFDYAREHGETNQYHQNYSLNTACAAAIDLAVKESNYEPNHYDLKAAAKAVIKDFGAERVEAVLAATIQKHDYDSRYSDANKQWARGFDLPLDSVMAPYTHPYLLNGFVQRFREAAAEKPSVLQTLAENAEKSRQQASKSEPGKDVQKIKQQEI